MLFESAVVRRFVFVNFSKKSHSLAPPVNSLQHTVKLWSIHLTLQDRLTCRLLLRKPRDIRSPDSRATAFQLLSGLPQLAALAVRTFVDALAVL
jgi:hypothetical protein